MSRQHSLIVTETARRVLEDFLAHYRKGLSGVEKEYAYTHTSPKACSYKMGNYTGPVPIHLHHIDQISCGPKLFLLTCMSAQKVYWAAAGNASSIKE